MKDLGLTALLMMARHHGISVDEAQLRHEFGQNRFSTETILLGAKHLGMTAKVVTQDHERLDRTPLPAIAIDKQGNYFIAVKFGYNNGDKAQPIIITQEPGNPTPNLLKLPEFMELWSGQLILFTSRLTYLKDLSLIHI